MREVSTNRALHAVMRALGVQNPGAINVQVPTQLVEIVGDCQGGSPPLTYSTYGIYRTEPAVVGERSGVFIQAGAGGLWFQTIGNHSDAYVMARNDVLAVTGQTAIVPQWLTGNAVGLGSAAILAGFHMTLIALGTPAFSFERGSSSGLRAWDLAVNQLYLGPGQRLLFHSIADAVEFDLGIIWREVPPIGG